MKVLTIVLLAAVLLSAEDYKLAMSWGEKGDGPGQLRGAHGIAIDNSGDVIVVDSRSSHVYRYTPDGKFLGEIGLGPGDGNGQFKSPRDAAVRVGGKIYVADGANNRIQVFGPDGKFQHSSGQKGKGPGEFLRAHALGFDPISRLFIADVDNSRIAVYDANDKFVTAWGKAGSAPGEFHAPHGLGVDRRGDVIVSNYYGPVQKFTPQGKLLNEFGAFTAENNLLSYHSMCLDREGNIYITTRDKERRSSITKYDNGGKLVTQWRMPQPRQLIEDVAVDSIGRVFVTYQGREGTGVHVFARQ
ncbi:MAG: NHL repeat-containing protein [Candidatus Hydrogenedentes bacterium]|nr:NHL repeat-containing protein [Candidatus Hydrogenedentota bacterium]